MPRNIPISITKNTDKQINFIESNLADLRHADITLSVKRAIVDPSILFSLPVNINISPDLEHGKFSFIVQASDIENLTPRTYKYEVKIIQNEQTIIPLIGDFKVYPSVSD